MDIKVLQLHKRASYEFKHIQDKYALDSDTKIFALADGTTQSFNSEIWAEIITKEFVSNPTFNTKELINIFKNQVAKYKNTNFEFSSNPAKASLEKAKQNKGGTSTFMGLQFKSENKVELISCGDTNLFLINSENKVIGYPFSNVDNLDENNYFINTEQLIQNHIDDTFFKIISFEFN
jgi:serine/threonine protein phosphatase PrpC